VEVGKGDGQLARRIGHLPEEPAFYTWMTPLEFLDYVGRIFGLPDAQRKSRTKELLELVGLAEAGKRRIGGFSRGMRQRLGLAQALVNRPQVIFLDEPVSALDPAGRRDVLELITRLKGETTVFMSTHILADVERVCDVVGIIAKGRMLVQSPRQLLLEHYAIPAFEVEGDDHTALTLWAGGLRHLPWVISVAPRNGAFRITVRDVQVAKRELLAQAVNSGLSLNRYEEVRPSLEDVFLQLVGLENVA
jgi:ABC-2 type transport system ATP-binding protein